METQDDGEQPDYGSTEAVIDVTGSFGPHVGDSVVIVEDDPGWLNGYAFGVGTHYFIPYVENEKGRYSHLCDPIAEIDRADVAKLVELAEQNTWASDLGDDKDPSEQAVGVESPTSSHRLKPSGNPGLRRGVKASGSWRSWGSSPWQSEQECGPATRAASPRPRRIVDGLSG